MEQYKIIDTLETYQGRSGRAASQLVTALKGVVVGVGPMVEGEARALST